MKGQIDGHSLATDGMLARNGQLSYIIDIPWEFVATESMMSDLAARWTCRCDADN
jgi:hypothetical protein